MDTSTLYQTGLCQVLVDTSLNNSYYSYDYTGEELDFVITSDVSNNDIRLNIEVGSDNSNNLSFHYHLLSNIFR